MDVDSGGADSLVGLSCERRSDQPHSLRNQSPRRLHCHVHSPRSILTLTDVDPRVRLSGVPAHHDEVLSCRSVSRRTRHVNHRYMYGSHVRTVLRGLRGLRGLRVWVIPFAPQRARIVRQSRGGHGLRNLTVLEVGKLAFGQFRHDVPSVG